MKESNGRGCPNHPFIPYYTYFNRLSFPCRDHQRNQPSIREVKEFNPLPWFVKAEVVRKREKAQEWAQSMVLMIRKREEHVIADWLAFAVRTLTRKP